MTERQLITWLIRGFGGLANMVDEWIRTYGDLPKDQLIELKVYLDKIKGLTCTVQTR
jgi:hypothetical protein